MTYRGRRPTILDDGQRSTLNSVVSAARRKHEAQQELLDAILAAADRKIPHARIAAEIGLSQPHVSRLIQAHRGDAQPDLST